LDLLCECADGIINRADFVRADFQVVCCVSVTDFRFTKPFNFRM